MKRYGGWIWAIVSALGYLLLASTTRTDSAQLLGIWTALFLLYGLALYYHTSIPFYLLIGAAVAFRAMGLLSPPLLSDDVYRFIWDGRLLAQEFNPFLYLPTEVLSTDIAARAGLDKQLFQKLNSPTYYSVYPPLLQVGFWAGATFGSTEAGTILWLRFPILLGELATLWFLYQLLRQGGREESTVQKGVLLYALNPLVILELVGNIHYEGLTICFLLACLYFFQKNRENLSATFLGFAVGVKLLPLIFLPAFLDKDKPVKSLRYGLIVGVCVVVPFLFFFDSAVIERFSTSLDLYFRRFEFNAGLYYLLRSVGTWLVGYNPIGTVGPLLSLFSFSGILYIAFSKRITFIFYERLLLILTLYLLCATTVHPWYVTPLVALGVLGRFRYPIAWSALLPFTYLSYGQVPFEENLWVVAVEYLVVVGWFLWEVYTKRESLVKSDSLR